MHILAVLFPDFTALDLIGPVNCWAFMPDTQTQFAALRVGPIKTDCGAQILATHNFENCVQNPDVLVVPGGGLSVAEALQDDLFLDHVARIGSQAGWVTSVCSGSLILGAAGLLRGYKAACHWYAREDLRKFGAEPVNERVVMDRNRATGGGVTAGIDFGLKMIEQWAGADAGQLTELAMEYAPRPPFGTGRPELAPRDVVETAKGILARELPNELIDRVATRRGFKVSRAEVSDEMSAPQPMQKRGKQ
jgi:cyclohexyl-isocyanide hydratase